jgi:hypothetical protein
MNCTICKLPTGNIVGSVLPQCKCGWQAPQPPVTQRTWVGLTEEEKSELWEISRAAWPRYITYASLAEAKLKEKNT